MIEHVGCLALLWYMKMMCGDFYVVGSSLTVINWWFATDVGVCVLFCVV